MKRTNLITFDGGKAYRVYMDEDGRLLYKAHGHWCGTWESDCMEGNPDRKK